MSKLAGAACPTATAARLGRYRYGRASSSSTGRSTARSRGARRRSSRAGTVHLGGTLDEIAAGGGGGLAAASIPARPFVLLVQPSLFDPTRAPAGKHTAWAYCHVPNGSARDMTEAIEAQVERFAPGFRDLIAARSAMGPAEMERRNPNYVGGDINGGLQDLRQLFTRPVARPVPYSTPVDGSTSARRRRRRAAACTACAGTSPLARRFAELSCGRKAIC